MYIIPSLFDDVFRTLLIKSINKDYLSNTAYAKNTSYVVDNIAPIIEKVAFGRDRYKDKDNLRFINALSLKTLCGMIYIWFIGYKDYNKNNNSHITTVDVGSSITIQKRNSGNDWESPCKETLNILLDTATLGMIYNNSSNPSNMDEQIITSIFDYWVNIFNEIITHIGCKPISDRIYSMTVIGGVQINGLTDYLYLVVSFHLYTILYYRELLSKRNMETYRINETSIMSVITKKTKLSKEEFLKFYNIIKNSIDMQ